MDPSLAVAQMRSAFAIRGALMSEDGSLKTGRSRDMWLRVLAQMTTGERDAIARRLIADFLVIQPQSAACERSFATVEELKSLGGPILEG